MDFEGKTPWEVAQVVASEVLSQMWGYDPVYPWQTTWVVPLGVAQPTRQRLTGHDSARRLL